MLGTTIHYLTVLTEATKANGLKRYLCQCICGNQITAYKSNLVRGATKSCGCWGNRVKGKNRTTHGLSNTREYRIWAGIKKRCYNPNSSMYPTYGGKGITMCESWLTSFDSFLSDVGFAPSSKHSIDRIDNSLGYSPDNCRWATPQTQTLNRRCTVLINTPSGALPLKLLSEQHNVSYFTAYDIFIRRKLPYDEAMQRINFLSTREPEPTSPANH